MKWKNNKNFKPEIILKKIDEIKIIKEDNTVSFAASQYIEAISILYNMIDFPENLLFFRKQQILKNAISNIAKEKLDKDKLINELNRLYKIETSKKENIYKILTSISISYPLPMKSIVIGKSKIEFMKDYPKKYFSREDSSVYAKEKLDLDDNQYTKIIITIKEKSDEIAINQAFDDLDLLRAIFSLKLNSFSEINIFGVSKDIPINKIRLGKYHTIHDINGKNINPERYWFEPNYEETKVYYHSQDEIESLKKDIKFVLSQLKKCKFSKNIEKALLRYVRAFDEKDSNVAFLKVWSALEYIITNDRNNKNDLVKRCSFLYKDGEYTKQIFEHLREYRNETVHSGIRNEEVRYYCFQIQRVFKQLIFFCLRKANEFDSIEDMHHFLDYSDNLSKLEKDKEILERVIKFRKA
ncbi:HEPN domain-containing protein [Aliarcobacter butzleri]|uniref:HEPN domain-containing protein n=1 Tax=Aliarcobacter butzleri TaxID=28197 RepID=UPI0021B1D4DE|nr:HEPN domain-containing protein [Aliarcobacter butzleri]MCT7613875.1 HEPN domain-containing protein [Aliarcobacter butzleri]